MSRIQFPDRQPPERHTASARTHVSRQKRKRMSQDEEYNTVVDIYRENNPTCAGCGKPFKSFHHIARGPNRRASLTNTDLGMGACQKCHEQWDDKGNMPVAKQMAVKFIAILRRYQEIARQQVCIQDVMRWMKSEE